MKKFVWLLYPSLLVGCSSTSPNSTQLAGDWVCMTNYPEAQTQVLDQIHYGEAGKLTIQGVILSPIEKPLFAFKTEYSGSWSLKNGELNYQIQSQNVSRAHNSTVQQIIAKEPNVRQLEADLYQAYSSPRNFSGLTIKENEGKTMLITQMLNNQVQTTACMRKEEK